MVQNGRNRVRNWKCRRATQPAVPGRQAVQGEQLERDPATSFQVNRATDPARCRHLVARFQVGEQLERNPAARCKLSATRSRSAPGRPHSSPRLRSYGDPRHRANPYRRGDLTATRRLSATRGYPRQNFPPTWPRTVWRVGRIFLDDFSAGGGGVEQVLGEGVKGRVQAFVPLGDRRCRVVGGGRKVMKPLDFVSFAPRRAQRTWQAAAGSGDIPGWRRRRNPDGCGANGRVTVARSPDFLSV